MLSRCLKKTLVFSVITAGMILFILSCENPFSNNLGAKVDVEPPTVTIETPNVGSLLKGHVRFTGSATAFRELKSVEVSILNAKSEEEAENPSLPPILDWTPIPIEGGTKEKSWIFDLDTVNFTYTDENGEVQTGLPDDFLHLKFRANDSSTNWKGKNETVALVYIVKNKPSTIKTTAPSSELLVNSVSSPPKIGTATEILGSVVDRRGIKPGYPQIKFWPESPNAVTGKPVVLDPATNEPYDDDPNWGWAILPLSGLDDDERNDYRDRANMRVVNAGNFAFRLVDHTINPVTRRIEYVLDAGQYVPLPSVEFRFRIKTYETYFEENVSLETGEKNDRYMFPRAPDPAREEVELEANYPEKDQPAYKILLVSTGTRPDIDIDNGKVDASDLTPTPLPAEPHIYITEPASNKILVDNVKYPDTNWNNREIFRLQVRATHEEPIQKAILQWSHMAGAVFREGYLMWDDLNGTDDYDVTTSNDTRAEFGYLGTTATDTRGGKFFRFTAKGSQVSNSLAGATAAAPFVASTEPYTLTVTVPSSGGPTIQKFTLYLDGEGPKVTIRTVRGASEGPATANGNAYLVNGNIQVSIDSSASRGVVAEKWWIENIDPGLNNATPAAGSMRAKLEAFRADPIMGDPSFFDNINNTAPASTRSSGLVTGPDPNGAFAEDKASNFKVNVGRWQTDPTLNPSGNPVDVWLYIIVRDGAYNLGYNIVPLMSSSVPPVAMPVQSAVQKLRVDENTDKPILTFPDTSLDVAAIDGVPRTGSLVPSIDDLYINMVSNPTKPRINVLSGAGSGTPIDLKFADDDAIRPGGVTITLTAHNTNTTATLSATQITSMMGLSAGSTTREWAGALSQSAMSQAFTPALSSASGALLDGLYTITIAIADDLASKVYFSDPSENSPAKTASKTLHFAVHSNNGPAVTISAPADKSMQTSTPVDVYGTVTSRSKVQALRISFAPEVKYTPAGTTTEQNASGDLTLYTSLTTNAGKVTGVGAITDPLAVTTGLGSDGVYTYYWVRESVNFDPGGITGERRQFTVTAWDGLTEQGYADREVQVDTTAPEVAFVQFNYDRLYQDGSWTVNGKVPIEISATDANGIAAISGTPPNVVTYAIKWFILPKGTVTTGANYWTDLWDNPPNTTTSRSGLLTSAQSTGGGNYRFFINTGHIATTGTVDTSSSTSLTDNGEYVLYVLAKDTAGNVNTPTGPLHTFKVAQDSDLPYLRRDQIYPTHNSKIGGDNKLEISGRIFDDDGFDAAKAKTPTRKYVFIRIRYTPTGGSPTIWTGTWNGYTTISYGGQNGWIPVGDKLTEAGVFKGDLEYLFKFDVVGANPQRHPAFSDGTKEYQIMVLDEATATTDTDARGKNPDTGNPAPGTTNPTIPEIRVYYPGANPAPVTAGGNPNANPVFSAPTDWYRFDIKATPPKIVFRVNDTTVANRVPKAYNNVNDVLADLQGGYINDISLNNASFTYGGETRTLEMNVNSTTGEPSATTPQGVVHASFIGITPDKTSRALVENWTWRIGNGTIGSNWLEYKADNTTPLTSPFSAAPDGLQTVTVRAADTLGKPGFGDWTFYKDTTGPSITFGNIGGNYPPISGATETGALYVTGQIDDLYSNIAATFDFRFDNNPWQVNQSTNAGAGITYTVNGNTATFSVRIPGNGYDDENFRDGPHTFSIRVRDTLSNTSGVGDNTLPAPNPNPNPVAFVVDRRAPEMLVAVDNLRLINNILKNPDGTNIADGTMAESIRVFSAPATNPAASARVFTLSGIVYEHNLSELRVNLRNGTTAIDTLAKTLTNIDAAAVAWKNSTAPTLTYYGNGSGNDTTGVNTVNSTIRIKRATVPDLTTFGVSRSTADYCYVWEVDISDGDFFAMKTAAGGSGDDVNRSISVTALDLARKTSETRNWPFKLDVTAPTITFTNLTAQDITLEDQSIILQVSVNDTSDIQTVQYMIEKYTHSGATWPVNTVTAGTGTWAAVTGTDTGSAGAGWKFWTITPNRILNLRISDNDAITGDGYYRVTVKAADGSLKTTVPLGNESTSTPVRYFYVDRGGPVLDWGTTNSFYRWNSSNQIVFTVIATDANAIKASALSGTLTLKNGDTVTVVGDSADNSNTDYPVTLTVASANATANPATLTATIALKGGQTLASGVQYTLTLNVQDNAGIKTLAGHTTPVKLDNQAPAIALEISEPKVAGTEAITGRIELRGRFTKTSGLSRIRRVAYKIDTGSAPAVPATPENFNDADLNDDLKAKGWFFNTGENTDPWKLWVQDNNALGAATPTGTPEAIAGKGLVEIDQGLQVANMKIYDTRRLVANRTATVTSPGTAVLGAPITTAPAGVTFNGKEIATEASYTNKTVHALKIWLLAIDDAGNSAVQAFDYYVYPAGDIPVVTQIINPSETGTDVDRRLNGSITISGTAVDNYQIRQVWFRVLKDAATAGTDMNIPEWDSSWNATNVMQPHNQVINGTTGWYKASGGGSKEVSWWAQINTRGELDPQGTATEQKITVEVAAEDTIRDDYTGGHTTTGNHISVLPNRSVPATVVVGAPTFTDEQVRSAVSTAGDGTITWGGWGAISTNSVRKRASYQVTVKHLSGVGQVRWTNAPASLGVTASKNLLDADYQAVYASHLANISTNSTSNQGIAVKVEPKNPISGSTDVNLSTTKKYMIWTPFASSTTGVPASTENVRYAIFTPTSAITDTNGAVLLEQQTDGTFEWLITIDIDSSYLVDTGNTTYANKAKNYIVELQATDNSKPNPIMGRFTARIPIDNIAPRGLYSHSTNIAGTAPTFGGEAGDRAGLDGAEIGGLSRVVLWFSRRVEVSSGVYAERSIVWDENRSGANTTFNNHTGTALVVADIGNWAGRDPAYSGVVLPTLPAASGLTAGANNSCVVIDQHDPNGAVTHHGHKLGMGFTDTSGDLRTAWYVGLNSMFMESGRVTAHYIVYDKAGNATYFNQRLMILNGVPKINTITLATDIGTQTTLDAALGSGKPAGNLTFTEADENGAMKRIRTAMGLTTDVARGISEEIVVDTSRPGVYNVVVDRPDFMVRNGLLAIKVDTVTGQLSPNKARYYRVEYVNSARQLNGVSALRANSTTSSQSGIRAGKVYIINNPGTNFPWGVLGVQADQFRTGTAFLAMVDGSEIDLAGDSATWDTIYGAPSVWELNGSYYQGTTTTTFLNRTIPSAALQFSGSTNNDIRYAPSTGGNGKTAEFVYRSAAFGTAANTIRDFNANSGANLDELGRPKPYPVNTGTSAEPWNEHSLFIIKVFDGADTNGADPGLAEADLFGDFALLSVRVNNNDVTPPYAQLYDMNPKTEEQAQGTALNPQAMGVNRTRGGLYNTGTTASTKSGHIEPRSGTSLTNADMGGGSGAGTINRPVVNTGAYFTVDTVSGDVIVRGYAEDNQRIARVDLEIYAENNTTRRNTVTILSQAVKSNNGALIAVDANRVSLTQTIDLNRHRVEWSYLWSSESIPTDIVGNFNIRAIAFNANSTPRTTANDTTVPTSDRVYSSARRTLGTTATPGNARSQRNAYDSFNPGFPVGADNNNFFRYNDISVNIRPYITGFLRNTANFAHNIRSRQGRYIFARGETVVVTGFNLGNAANDTLTTNIVLPGGGTSATVSRPAVYNFAPSNYGLTETNGTRYRSFLIPADTTGASVVASGNGLVTLTVGARQAVNTGAERPQTTGPRPTAVQPWNIEYSAATDGSDLWDDFTQIHIWRSDDNVDGTNNGRFPASPGWIPEYPAMSIDAATGVLYSSHNEGGSGHAYNSPASGNAYGYGGQANYNSATSRLSDNTNVTASANLLNVVQFNDPIIMSDVYRSPSADPSNPANLDQTWTAFNIIGRSQDRHGWNYLGGIYMHGPGGERVNINMNANNTAADNNISRYLYVGESTYYNASQYGPNYISASPPINQFANPHIVTSGTNIHVAYYDTKDGSIKYRYNAQNSPGWTGTFDGGPYDSAGSTTQQANRNNLRRWVNLDGGYDPDDTVAIASPTVAQDARLVRGTSRPIINAGEHNAIALASGGFPVIAYFDATNQRLKLAVSNKAAPVTANDWIIRDFVIPDGNLSASGTGQYVSMKIDTRVTPNIIHIAALNSVNKQLVYVTGQLDTSFASGNTQQTTGGVLTPLPGQTAVTVQVVDSVGDVGRWCSLSLDEDGNPWISYQDESNKGSRDGVKVAYRNKTTFTKGATGAAADRDRDIYGADITGWEAMHVPTQFRVQDSRLGMENYPTRNYTGTKLPLDDPDSSANKAKFFWKGAVGYLAEDYFRIAYYVK